MVRKALPAGFIVPAQPVARTVPPSGAGWVHEIKHDGYRIIVRRDATGAALLAQGGRLDRSPPGDPRCAAGRFTLDEGPPSLVAEVRMC